MNKRISQLLPILRWFTRGWSLFVAFFVAMMFLVPQPASPGATMPWADQFLLAMYLVATVGLLLGWRWEALGGGLAIVATLIEIVGFKILRGGYPDAMSYLVPIIGFALPGALYLWCWYTSCGKTEVAR